MEMEEVKNLTLSPLAKFTTFTLLVGIVLIAVLSFIGACYEPRKSYECTESLNHRILYVKEGHSS